MSTRRIGVKNAEYSIIFIGICTGSFFYIYSFLIIDKYVFLFKKKSAVNYSSDRRVHVQWISFSVCTERKAKITLTYHILHSAH